VITEKQIAALRYLIFRAKPDNKLIKQVLVYLLEKSGGMREQVYLSLHQDREGYTGEEISRAAIALHAFESCNGNVHLDQIMIAMGTDFQFSTHYGHYETPGGTFITKGLFPGAPNRPDDSRDDPLRYTFWLAKGSYGRAGGEIEVRVSRGDLEKINLDKPGLYPGLENQRLFR
jgi:hypothetical protein